MSPSVELRHQRAKLAADMALISDSTRSEDIRMYARMDAEQARLLAQIERMERAASLEADAPPSRGAIASHSATT